MLHLVLSNRVPDRLLPPDVALGDGVGEGRAHDHLHLVRHDPGGVDGPGEAGPQGEAGAGLPVVAWSQGGEARRGEVAAIPGLGGGLAPRACCTASGSRLLQLNQDNTIVFQNQPT
jgi:hypothetical protein